MTYFLDGDGNLCGHDEIVKDYDWVYFASINDPVILILCSQKDFVSQNVLKQVIKF
jgi:hypothetical protein